LEVASRKPAFLKIYECSSPIAIPDFYGSTRNSHSKSSSVRAEIIMLLFASLNTYRLVGGMLGDFLPSFVSQLTGRCLWLHSDGHYGLYLDDALFEGSSAPCPTFDNEPLCSPGPKKGSTVEFECVGVEVWAMGP